MKWDVLISKEQLDLIDMASEEKAVLIFKHSTRCGYSISALNRIEVSWGEDDHPAFLPYFLDLLQYRSVSDAVASRYHIPHESPQVLVISKGKCIYFASHQEIQYAALMTLPHPD